jgi:hypothetical protein
MCAGFLPMQLRQDKIDQNEVVRSDFSITQLHHFIKRLRQSRMMQE